jgi:hypothetical protein
VGLGLSAQPVDVSQSRKILAGVPDEEQTTGFIVLPTTASFSSVEKCRLRGTLVITSTFENCRT